MFRFTIRLAVFAVAFLAWDTRCLVAADKEANIAIVSPKDGAKAAQSEEVEGKLNIDGWPVVLVQPQAGEKVWWIQEPVEEIDKGKFTVPVRLGDDKTPVGTKFKLVIIVAKDKQEAQKYERGKTRATLPPGLPKSEPVVVSRGE